MRFKGFLPAFNILAICLGFSGTQAFGFGHGGAVGLHNFVTQETKVRVATVSSSALVEGVVARHSLGRGLDVAIIKSSEQSFLKRFLNSPNAEPNSIEATWRPNALLAVIELHNNSSAADRALVKSSKVLFHNASLNTNLYVSFLTPEALKILSLNPLNFIDPVSSEVNEDLNPDRFAAKEKTPINFRSAQNTTASAVILTPSTERMLLSLNELSGEQPVSAGRGETIPERGSKNSRKLAQEYLQARFLDLELDAQLRCYKQNSYEGCNVEGTLWGSDRSSVTLITAHLDSVSNKGADDDASGIAAILEVAQLLKTANATASYRFVGFDQEELGLIGSKAYVSQITSGEAAKTEPTIKAVFQMDMIAFDSDQDGTIHAMDCGKEGSTAITKSISETLADLKLPLKIKDACTDRSDHASFWRKGIPATIVSENFFGGDDNTCYHKKCDTISLVNLNYMTNIVKLVANSAYRFSE